MEEMEELKIRKTSDYGMFKRMIGNRPVKEGHVRRLMDSMKKVGLIPEPIIINEKFEVINGQHRLEACKRLGLPVYYAIIPGIGEKECIEMNTSIEGWKTFDYILYYDEKGIEPYVILKRLIDEHKDYNLGAILIAAAGTTSIANDPPMVRDGSLDITEDDAAKAEDTFKYWDQFDKAVVGRNNNFFRAVTIIKNSGVADEAELVSKVNNYGLGKVKLTTTDDYIDAMESAYNTRRRKGYVSFKQVYREYLQSKGVGPANKAKGVMPHAYPSPYEE